MKSLPVFDPFVELDRMFETLWPTRARTAPTEGNLLLVDVFEKDEQWILRASLPGVKQDDIDLQVEDGVLTLRGRLDFQDEHKDAKVYRREIATGTFVRSVRLPDNVNLEGIEASFANGLVTVTIPKIVEVKPAPIKVPVKAVEADSN